MQIEVIDVILALNPELLPIYVSIQNDDDGDINIIEKILDNINLSGKIPNKMNIDLGMSKLDEKLKKIIKERYYNGKTQKEITEELDITLSQVSRLEKKTLKIIFDEE